MYDGDEKKLLWRENMMKLTFTENGLKTELPYGELHISPKDEHGFRPFQLMVASVSACSLSVFRQVLQKQRVQFEELYVEAEVSRKEDEANRIEQIDLTFTIKGENLKEERLKKSLEVSSKNCSMVRSVQDSIRIVKHLEIV